MREVHNSIGKVGYFANRRRRPSLCHPTICTFCALCDEKIIEEDNPRFAVATNSTTWVTFIQWYVPCCTSNFLLPVLPNTILEILVLPIEAAKIFFINIWIFYEISGVWQLVPRDPSMYTVCTEPFERGYKMGRKQQKIVQTCRNAGLFISPVFPVSFIVDTRQISEKSMSVLPIVHRREALL